MMDHFFREGMPVYDPNEKDEDYEESPIMYA